MSIDIRDITDLAGCRAVVGVQEEVWGAESEIVPASLLVASIKRGGILVGAYDGDRLAGFVWSLPAWRDGVNTHWSHMLGVVPDARGRRTGERLKWAQRDRALSQGVDLVEWTFDPLQAPNAHLNLSILGCVASTYLVDAYGSMSGPLHRGTPTDRLIAEWWIRRPHVERRRAASDPERAAPAGRLGARSSAVLEATPVLDTRPAGDWEACGGIRTNVHTTRVLVPVPAKFGEMQQRASDLALEWRAAARDAFQTYFARGYVAVDFFLNREQGNGAYLLAGTQNHS